MAESSDEGFSADLSEEEEETPSISFDVSEEEAVTKPANPHPSKSNNKRPRVEESTEPERPYKRRKTEPKTVATEHARAQPLPTPKPKTQSEAVPSGTPDNLTNHKDWEEIPCREDEQKQIYDHVLTALELNSSSALFVSGVPGTGKTATVKAAINLLQKQAQAGELPKFVLCEINGMKMSSPNQAWVEIWRQFTGKRNQKKSYATAKAALQSHFESDEPNKTPVVLVIDELDYLCPSSGVGSKRYNVVYSLFDWARKEKSRLSIVSITNTMDLGDKLGHQRVGSRMGNSKVQFHAYTKEQLRKILEARLAECAAIFQGGALQYIAVRVSMSTTDTREAVQLAREALMLAEEQYARESVSSPDCPLKEVTVEHVLTVLKNLKSHAVLGFLTTLSEHQRLFLIALLELQQRTDGTLIIKQVMERYYMLARRHEFDIINQSQVATIYHSLHSLGFIKLELPWKDRCHKGIQGSIQLNLTPDDVQFALKDDEVAIRVWGPDFYTH